MIRPPLPGIGTCVDSPGEDRECEGVSYNQRCCSVVGSMGLDIRLILSLVIFPQTSQLLHSKIEIFLQSLHIELTFSETL